MADDIDMFDGAIRHQQPMFKIKIFSSLRSTLDCLFHGDRVFRMSPLENKFHGRSRRSFVLVYPKGFFRPDDLACSDPPAETPGMTEPLSFRQIRLALPKRSLGQPS